MNKRASELLEYVACLLSKQCGYVKCVHTAYLRIQKKGKRAVENDEKEEARGARRGNRGTEKEMKKGWNDTSTTKTLLSVMTMNDHIS